MENLTGQTVWITKYALTKGIISAKVKKHSSSKFEYLYLENDSPNIIYDLGKNAFLTEDDAKVKARVMRDEKVESLKKQIKKLVSMEF